MIPFASTRAERMANGDPRLSLEERYKTHDGYVAAVKAAATKAVAEKVLLQDDADKLVPRRRRVMCECGNTNEVGITCQLPFPLATRTNSQPLGSGAGPRPCGGWELTSPH